MRRGKEIAAAAREQLSSGASTNTVVVRTAMAGCTEGARPGGRMMKGDWKLEAFHSNQLRAQAMQQPTAAILWVASLLSYGYSCTDLVNSTVLNCCTIR